MNAKQINNKVKQIEIMDRGQLEEFAATVHNSVGMPELMFREFMRAIDARHIALKNSFNFEVEDGEYKAEEMQ